MTAVLDPFATAGSLGPDAEDPERVTGGRYRLPDLTIGADGALETRAAARKGGWQRVTTLVKAISDARALDLWHQRLLIVGMVARPDLYDLSCATYATLKDDPDPRRLRGALEGIAGRLLAAAGADIGATTGTAFHGFVDAADLGLAHYARAVWHGKLRNYREGLAEQRLTVDPAYMERRVVCLRYGLAGMYDRLLWDEANDCYRVGDLKSQKKFWEWIQIAAQLAAYQMADAMWDRPTLSYVQMPKVADDAAVVAWMPIAHPAGLDGTGAPGAVDSVDFFDVDLEKGRRALQLCHEVDRMRSEARSVNQTWGLLRPAPELSRVEAYARRLDAVSTPAEGSALWAEIVAQGLGETPELLDLARKIAGRFLPQ